MASTYNEQLHKIWQKYEDAGMPMPASKYDIADWAIQEGLWAPHPVKVRDQCANDLAKAAGLDYRIDEKGRKYRAKHPLRIDSDGVQITLWADIDKAPVSHMERSLGQRRKRLVGMGFQLKTDHDVFYDRHSEIPLEQLVLDLTPDVQELEALRDVEDKDLDLENEGA